MFIDITALYADAGYDILALTDHWKYGEAFDFGKMKVLSGCEYNIIHFNEETGADEIFHIVGLDMKEDPEIPEHISPVQDISQHVQTIVKMIRAAGGVPAL